MIRIAVCDDEKIAVRWICDRVKKAFEKKNEEIHIETFFFGSDLRNAILEGVGFDVLFLDINMPDINGIFLATHLKSLISDTLVIFVSSQEEEVFHSFVASPFRFLRKSRLDKEIPQIVSDILAALKEKKSENIILKFRQSYLSVNPYKVFYIESNRKQQTIHLVDQIYEVNYRLKELEELFGPFGYLKPHNSYLVNYRFITSIKQTDIILDNGELIPVSKHRLSDIKQEYLRLISEN